MSWRFLHPGPLGVAEAGLIGLAAGLLAFGCFHRLARRHAWPEGRALGWACVVALVAVGGMDFFQLLQVFRLNPLYPARVEQVLRGIHDPEWLGARFVAESLGALAGAFAGWAWVASRADRSG